MTTQCSEGKLIFHELDSREVVGRFDGSEITSDAGAVLLREVEKRTGILGRMSECFEDHRDPERIEHTVESLVKWGLILSCVQRQDGRCAGDLETELQSLANGLKVAVGGPVQG